MSKLTRDGTAEPVSRGQILRRERGQEISIFPVRVAKKMRTCFEMETDGHRFLCFQIGI